MMTNTNQLALISAVIVIASSLVTACGEEQKTSYSENTRQPIASDSTRQPIAGNSTENPMVGKPLTPGRQVALLAGSAALYYMLRKNQDQRMQGQKVQQYYLSKNGRVYYRGPNHEVHWVTAPPSGIRVPEAEAQAYNLDQFQGYNGQNVGRSLAGLKPSTFY